MNANAELSGAVGVVAMRSGAAAAAVLKGRIPCPMKRESRSGDKVANAEIPIEVKMSASP